MQSLDALEDLKQVVSNLDSREWKGGLNPIETVEIEEKIDSCLQWFQLCLPTEDQKYLENKYIFSKHMQAFF